MLHVCGYSWLSVVLPCFMCVGFRGWILCFMLQVCGASWVDVVMPDQGVRFFISGCHASAFGLVWSFEASGRILHPGTGAGFLLFYSVRRRSRIKQPSIAGIFLRCLCSMYQLFKLSSWDDLCKSFTGEKINKNLIFNIL